MSPRGNPPSPPPVSFVAGSVGLPAFSKLTSARSIFFSAWRVALLAAEHFAISFAFMLGQRCTPEWRTKHLPLPTALHWLQWNAQWNVIGVLCRQACRGGGVPCLFAGWHLILAQVLLSPPQTAHQPQLLSTPPPNLWSGVCPSTGRRLLPSCGCTGRGGVGSY